MRLREIFRFELLYQARLVRTWLYFAVLLVVVGLFMNEAIEDARARPREEFVNSPHAIAVRTVVSSMLWLLIASAVAGSAVARDVETRMYPLVYTTPIREAEYLGGRFLAALVVNASILLAVPLGLLLAPLVLGAEPEVLGPFPPAAHLSSYFLIALPSVLGVSAVQFACAAVRGRTVAAYVGSVFLFIQVVFGSPIVTQVLKMRTLGMMLDATGFNTALSSTWTAAEKNTIVVGLTSSMLANRLVWVGVAVALFALTHRWFRFAHRAANVRAR